MLQPPPPTPNREANRNLWLGSSRGRRGGPGRQRGARRAAEPAQGGERSSSCRGPGHADFAAAPRGLASSLLNPSAHTGRESLSVLAQQRFPISSNISSASPRLRKGVVWFPLPGVSRAPEPEGCSALQTTSNRFKRAVGAHKEKRTVFWCDTALTAHSGGQT